MKTGLMAMMGTLAAATLAASPALALEVKEEAVIEAPIQKVWQQITEFCAVANWHPAVEKCELRDGAGKKQERVLSLKGGGTIEEQLQSVTASRRTVRYTLLSGPLPVANYSASIALTAGTKTSTTVIWSSHFDAKGASNDEARKVISGVYTSGLQGLKAKLEQR